MHVRALEMYIYKTYRTCARDRMFQLRSTEGRPSQFAPQLLSRIAPRKWRMKLWSEIE